MSRLPNTVAGWENPLELIQRQTAQVHDKLLPQMILMKGVLVDVHRSTDSFSSDIVYGYYAGQKMESKSTMRTRVLGLHQPAFHSSKLASVSGGFDGGFCYAMPDDELSVDDILVEVQTEAKWILSNPEVIGSAGARSIWRFRVSSMME